MKSNILRKRFHWFKIIFLLIFREEIIIGILKIVRWH
jgi:hypothetical protein